MVNFTRNLLTEWRKLKLPFDNETFLVAVSGGADSISLLLAVNELKKLKKLKLRFVVAHFNHELRGEESERDEQFVRKIAADFDFELAVKKGKVSAEGNLEQAARVARYEFLAETARNLHAYGVLTAHTLNDQAETFLLNLIRGSGLQGLGGMKRIRNLPVAENEKLYEEEKNYELRITNYELSEKEQNANPQCDSQSEIRNPKSKILLVRPLLKWATRAMTENFCHENEIDFQYDTMNEDLAFKRVRIRKVLLPLLEDFNPKIIENLAQTAFLLQEDFAALEKYSSFKALEFDKQTDDTLQEKLKLRELKNLFPSIRQQILRDWLKNMRGDLRGLDKKHFEAIEKLIFSRKSGRKAELPNGESVVKEKGNLIFVKNEGCKMADAQLQ